MWQKDTSLGGSRNAFPDTTQGILSGLKELAGGGYRSSFEAVCRRYWKPVYAFVRTAWARNNEDAKDLAQAFFLFLAEGDRLRRFDPARGSFRAYLKMILRSFVGHQERALAALKRGGGVALLPLDHDPSSLENLASSLTEADPEVAFERVWRTEIVCRALDGLKERSAAIPFQVFEAYDLVSDAERPTYKELADRFHLSEADVKRHLYRMREEMREAVRAELAQAMLTDRDFEDEWNRLFGG